MNLLLIITFIVTGLYYGSLIFILLYVKKHAFKILGLISILYFIMLLVFAYQSQH